MSAANSSARITQTTTAALFLASQTNENEANGKAPGNNLASQANAKKTTGQTKPMAGQKKTILASQERKEKTFEVKAPRGNGQKSKTIKVNGLTFRVRLSDRGYRVMLLTVEAGRQREPYLVSLRRNEWLAIENDKDALLAKVKEKLGQRIAKASENERAKLQSLFTWIT